MIKIRKNALLALFLILMLLPIKAMATEITAINFYGDVIGQVISTGDVINNNNQMIGSITADSLIVDKKGEIIGGAVPQGVAIGNDNKLLGSIHSDGSVRNLSGKQLGRVLPNGLVIDDGSEIIGSVLYPGIVYSTDGKTIGRLNGAGTYTNLEGQEIGFVSANGFAYRRVGEDYVLDGRLMSSKMIVNLNGEFIGSVAPTGSVINFEGKIIANIHANGYAYDKNNNIIGVIVETGYAFDLSGKYMGVITYNGEIAFSNNVQGKYRADGSIVNDKNEVIGFAVSAAATANDNSGHYLGRIIPGGQIVKGTDIVGRVGARGYIYDKENNKIGEIVKVGPIFDTLARLKGQGLRNGAVISLRGGKIGSMRGSQAFDSNGTLIGGTIDRSIAVDANNNTLGMTDIDASVLYGSTMQKISPFGYLFNEDGKVIGGSYTMSAVYGPEGLMYSYINPNGVLYRPSTNTKITSRGTVIDKNEYVGGIINPLYALSFDGKSLGLNAQNNVLLDQKGNIYSKIIPGGYAIEIPQKVTSSLSPIIGFSSNSQIALNFGGDLLGYIDNEGRLIDTNGQESGHIIANNYIVDNNNIVIGKAMPFAPVVNEKCSVIGVVNGRGDVINDRDVIIGRLLPNGQVISDVGSYTGYTTSNDVIIDFNGRFVGTVNNGKGISYEGKTLGCVSRQGTISDSDNKIIYGVVESAPVIGFDNEILGHVIANGSVIDLKGQNIGHIQPNGNVVSPSKKILGNVMKYKVAYGNDNKFLGMVQDDGIVVDQSGKDIGRVFFDGSVRKGEELLGYALYDFYVYDENFVTYGHLTKDGTVLSMVGSKLGHIDRGFVLDRSNQIVARGNRDYIVRDINNNAVGTLQMDGNVLDINGQTVGYLSEGGVIRNSTGNEIAQATMFQYYSGIAGLDRSEAQKQQPDWVERPKVNIAEETSYSEVQGGAGSTEYRPQNLGSKIIGIALNPDGDIIGNIYSDNSVRDDDGNLKGYKTPDGIIVDLNYNPIGLAESKQTSVNEMFIPDNAFLKVNPYINSQSTNAGPGGGRGQGEKYDPVKRRALTELQAQRRMSIAPGLAATSNIKTSNFTGYEDDAWPGSQRSISSWRVDMSEMILEDKPIPAVLARSVYGSDSGGFSSNIPVTAIVERNVYSEEGRNIIIPAGSRVIGDLGGEIGGGGVSGGAVKMQITWRRLIRPDGSQFTFGGAQTADAQGRAGALAYLDEQLLKKWTMPMVTSALESAVAYVMASGKGSSTTATGSTEDSRSQAAEDARQNFINQMNNIFEDIMNRKSQIKSVTYMPAGTRIIIFPKQDLWLNSEKRSGMKSGGEGYDNEGLTSDMDQPSSSGSRGGSSVSYNGNYQENVQPATANTGRNPTGYIQPANGSQQNSTAPASTNNTQKDDGVPDLI